LASKGTGIGPKSKKGGSVGLRLPSYTLLIRIVNYFNNKNIVTPEGLPVRVGLGDIAELAIKELAEKHKVE
jgi:acyl-CoA hydrolase